MPNCRSTGLSLPGELLRKIDAERGDISRSRYLLRLIERAYEAKNLKEDGLSVN